MEVVTSLALVQIKVLNKHSPFLPINFQEFHSSTQLQFVMPQLRNQSTQTIFVQKNLFLIVLTK